MAVYTEVDDKALADFLADFDLGPAIAFKGIAEGVENSNYLLETAKSRFILTLFEKRVNEEDLPYFMGVMDHLALKGFPAPLPVKANDGKALRTLCGRPAVIITFLTGMSLSRPNVEQCRDLGIGLAKFHDALSDYSGSRKNSLSVDAWHPMFKGREKEANAINAGLTSHIQSDLDELKANWPKDLPSGVIHADLFPDNAFFLDDKLTGVIDFYFACNDALAYDIAICLNAWCFEDSRGEYNVTKGRAMLAGYQSIRPLEDAEKDALPILCRGAAMRFFLTRLVDWADTPRDALVRPKNPIEYAEKLGFHRNAKGFFDYGG
ncbi:homoserine kinase [Hirschia baltica]|uniref:Homoserine kinase n=1 Tax=Hirschia baltica (strain ATCC 49814 / DSM 5838 / IFAM 1418) TaxID=582402 RepID=C6XRA5_HIRBI|nr:homoserine kinase [Hirschia baltica]ACT58737.1 homoserine kinase [Hirschia baltica ATCC 49814]